VTRVAEGLLRAGCPVIVVDDGSTDGATTDLEQPGISVLRLPENRGKGHAILAGMASALDHADTLAIAILDADGQHDPAELPRLYARFAAENADMVIGARRFDLSEVPFRSRLGNVLTRRLVRWMLGAHLPDTQSGYRILSRRFAEAVVREVPGGRYETEMEIVGLAIRRGYRIVSEPIRTIYEQGNATSHFRKVGDSFRVYRTLFRSAIARRRDRTGPTT
jgi:glycosyltransferase involved in cell wall biosynthesis